MARDAAGESVVNSISHAEGSGATGNTINGHPSSGTTDQAIGVATTAAHGVGDSTMPYVSNTSANFGQYSFTDDILNQLKRRLEPVRREAKRIKQLAKDEILGDLPEDDELFSLGANQSYSQPFNLNSARPMTSSYTRTQMPPPQYNPSPDINFPYFGNPGPPWPSSLISPVSTSWCHPPGYPVLPELGQPPMPGSHDRQAVAGGRVQHIGSNEEGSEVARSTAESDNDLEEPIESASPATGRDPV